jgi:hypothetical protein
MFELGGDDPCDCDWEQKSGRADRLEAVVQMGRDSIGDAHPSAEALAQRLRVCPEALQLLCRRHPDGRLELCGYSLLYPLTDEAGRAIAEARIHSTKELDPEAMLPDFAGAKHLYIGMVLGSPGGDARRRIKAQLRAELMRRIKEGAVNLVFARPASQAGQKLMLTHGFTPIKDERDIWMVAGASLLRITALGDSRVAKARQAPFTEMPGQS